MQRHGGCRERFKRDLRDAPGARVGVDPRSGEGPTLSTAAAPVIAATRLRAGSAASARAAASLVRQAITTARGCGPPARSWCAVTARFATRQWWPRAAGPGPTSRCPCRPIRNWPRRSPTSTRRHGPWCVIPVRSSATPPGSGSPRVGFRRSDRRTFGTSAVGAFRRQRRMAEPGRHGTQPDPRRRMPYRWRTRQSPRCDDAPQTDQHPGPDRSPRPAPDRPSTRRVAVAA